MNLTQSIASHAERYQDQEFESANEARSVARDAYLKHIHEHGCVTRS
jgi:hypothetical protein